MHVVRKCNPCHKSFPGDKYMECCLAVIMLTRSYRAGSLQACHSISHCLTMHHASSLSCRIGATPCLIIMLQYGELCCRWLYKQRYTRQKELRTASGKLAINKSTRTVLLNEHVMDVIEQTHAARLSYHVHCSM